MHRSVCSGAKLERAINGRWIIFNGSKRMKPLRPEASCAEMFVVPSLHNWRRVELGLMCARVASLWGGLLLSCPDHQEVLISKEVLKRTCTRTLLFLWRTRHFDMSWKTTCCSRESEYLLNTHGKGACGCTAAQRALNEKEHSPWLTICQLRGRRFSPHTSAVIDPLWQPRPSLDWLHPVSEQHTQLRVDVRGTYNPPAAMQARGHGSESRRGGTVSFHAADEWMFWLLKADDGTLCLSCQGCRSMSIVSGNLPVRFWTFHSSRSRNSRWGCSKHRKDAVEILRLELLRWGSSSQFLLQPFPGLL